MSMFRNSAYILFSLLFMGGLLSPFGIVLAQSGSIEPPVETTSATTSETVATSTAAATGTSAATSTPRAGGSPVSAPAASIPRATPPATNLTSTATGTTPAQDAPLLTEDAPTDSSTNPMLWVALGMLAVLPFGFFVAQSLKKKKTKEEKEDDSRCFDIKKLLDEKLKELTDLKGKLQSIAKDKAKEGIREAVQGTATGDTLALIEKAEKEYGRLKKLYEECMVGFGVRKRIIIVHGCPSNVEKAMNLETRTYDKHWMPWTKATLEERGYTVKTPLMPNPWSPDYSAFRAEFEKHIVSEKDILIGHSCGGAFLVRWLGDTKQKISKLILVAPWKIPDAGDKFREEYYGYEIDRTIPDRVGKIIIFTSNNEEDDGKRSVKIFHDALGGKVIDLKEKGHYTFDDMGTEEFPELLQEILS